MNPEELELISKGIKKLWDTPPSKFNPATFAFLVRFLSRLEVDLYGRHIHTVPFNALQEPQTTDQKPQITHDKHPPKTTTGIDGLSFEQVQEIFGT